ncbi:MAG: hypothetical protein ACD_21C00160G0003 [uncultured bacterium]|nr:MAG: hypothetical protein ACD_21C00160G0003 [uncultured bacterium]
MTIEKNWKYYLGIALFLYSFAPYVVGAVLFSLHIPKTSLLTILGAFIVSSEIAFVASIALLGKEFISAIKYKICNTLKLKAILQSTIASKVRHYAGVSLLLLSFLPYFIAEVSLFFGYPKTTREHIWLFLIMLSGDALFVISIFILDEDFWEKLKKLFEWKEAEIPIKQ